MDQDSLQNSNGEMSGTGTDFDPYAAMEYFRAKIRPWDVHMAPSPPRSDQDFPYPSTKDRKHFEHNLRLLCEGGVDAVYPNYHKEPYRGPDNIVSLIIGLIVGVIMFAMIYKEMHPKNNPYTQRRRRGRRRPSSREGSPAVSILNDSEGYESTPQQDDTTVV